MNLTQLFPQAPSTKIASITPPATPPPTVSARAAAAVDAAIAETTKVASAAPAPRGTVMPDLQKVAEDASKVAHERRIQEAHAEGRAFYDGVMAQAAVYEKAAAALNNDPKVAALREAEYQAQAQAEHQAGFEAMMGEIKIAGANHYLAGYEIGAELCK